MESCWLEWQTAVPWAAFRFSHPQPLCPTCADAEAWLRKIQIQMRAHTAATQTSLLPKPGDV